MCVDELVFVCLYVFVDAISVIEFRFFFAASRCPSVKGGLLSPKCGLLIVQPSADGHIVTPVDSRPLRWMVILLQLNGFQASSEKSISNGNKPTPSVPTDPINYFHWDFIKNCFTRVFCTTQNQTDITSFHKGHSGPHIIPIHWIHCDNCLKLVCKVTSKLIIMSVSVLRWQIAPNIDYRWVFFFSVFSVYSIVSQKSHVVGSMELFLLKQLFILPTRWCVSTQGRCQFSTKGRIKCF